MDKTREVEEHAEQKVAAWRETRTESKALRTELLEAIRTKTFNSAVLMRLMAEILLVENKTVEGLAAFDTYVSNQKLQLLKRKTGARSYPDEPVGTKQIFGLVLTVLEGEARFDHERIDKLGVQLKEIMDLSILDKAEIEQLYSGVRARVALRQALVSVDDKTHAELLGEARKWFDKFAESGDKDVETIYARGQLLALTTGPTEAFNLLKTTLAENPDHLRLALLFIQVLSAEDKIQESLMFTEAYLSKDLSPHSLLDKMALIELKKTHIALLELTRGPEVALNELPEFVEMVGFLFGASPEHEGTNGGSTTTRPHDHHTWGRIFPFRRRETVESIASSTKTPARDQSVKNISAYERGIVGIAWFWIAQQYARANLESEARESIDEARKFGSSEHELAYTANMHTILGQIESESRPERAIEHYHLALDADPIHVAAAIGIAMLTSEKSSEERDHQETRNILNVLEVACTRHPGRYAAEAWFARGMLYEALGGRDDAKEMYWKAVELEERRGVTRYVFLEPLLRN